MIWVFIKSQLANNIDDSSDDKDKLSQALLRRAMDFVNKTAGLSLMFNHPLHAHKTTESYIESVDFGDGTIMDKLNTTVMCISDDDDDDGDEFDNIYGNDKANINVISKKIDVKNVDDGNHTQLISCCCCPDYNAIFKKYFENTNFRLCSDIQIDKTKCLACSQVVERAALNTHLMKCLATKFSASRQQ